MVSALIPGNHNHGNRLAVVSHIDAPVPGRSESCVVVALNHFVLIDL